MNFWHRVKRRIRTTAAPNWTLTLIHPFSRRVVANEKTICSTYLYIYRKKKLIYKFSMIKFDKFQRTRIVKSMLIVKVNKYF